MLRIKQRGIKNLLNYLMDCYFEDEAKGNEYYRFSYNNFFNDDMEPSALKIYNILYNEINYRLNSLDLSIEKEDVQFSEESEFEISDKALKILTEQMNKKMENSTRKTEIENIFEVIDKELEIKDVSKFLAKQVDIVVSDMFEFDDFINYIDF